MVTTRPAATAIAVLAFGAALMPCFSAPPRRPRNALNQQKLFLFPDADANSDGVISQREWKAYIAEHPDALEKWRAQRQSDKPGRGKGPTQKPAPATRPAKPPDEKTLRRVKVLVDYYQRIYGEHLKSKDWFIRALSIIAMSRLDAPAITDRLLELLAEKSRDLPPDKDALVKFIAWEALHARTKSLSPDQHKSWVADGLAAAVKGGFRGDFRVGLLKAVTPNGPKAFDGQTARFVTAVLDDCSHLDGRDGLTLTQLRKLVAVWKDPDVIKQVMRRLTMVGQANKAEYVLGGLSDEVTPLGSVSVRMSASQGLKAKAAWMKWLKTAEPKGLSPGELPTYKGLSSLIPPAQRLDNPDDPKWRKDLELPTLSVDDFDLVFCIDATGSMLAPMQWVARSVASMMRVFRLTCREPRIGIVYYRHEVLPQLMHKCCKTLKASKGTKGPMFRTVTMPLTGRVEPMAAKMLTLNPRSGAYLHPGGAVHGGLYTALHKQPWKKTASAASARKIIVLIGDSPVTPGALPSAKALAASMAKKGWIIHGVTLKKLPSYEQVIAAAGGNAIPISFAKGRAKSPRAPRAGASGQIAAASGTDTRFRAVVGAIMRSMLPAKYHNRVDPLVKVLLDYAGAPVPQRRLR